MEHWLYVKFKDAFYYYLRMSEDKNETKKYIKDILEYDLFKKLGV